MDELEEVAQRLLRLTQAQEQREKLREQLRDTELVLKAVYLSGSLPSAKRMIKNWLVDQKVRGRVGPLDFERQDKLEEYKSWAQDAVVLLRQFTDEHRVNAEFGRCGCGMCERYQELLSVQSHLAKSTT